MNGAGHQSSAMTAVVAAIAAGALLYAGVLVGLLQQWYADPGSAHGVLVLAAAIWVVRRRWTALRTAPFAPHNGGFALLALAMVIYGIGSITGDIFVLRVSLPIALLAAVLCILGTRHARLVFAPLALLLLAIPLPSALVTHLTLPMQLLASQLAAGVLTAGGMEVVRSGNLLTLPTITLEVAEACSGLRSLVALVSIASVCVVVVPMHAARALLLVAAAVPIAVVGNGARIAATGVLATWFGNVAVEGLFHELTGDVAFVLMCAATFGLLWLTRRRTRTKSTGSQPYAPGLAQGVDA